MEVSTLPNGPWAAFTRTLGMIRFSHSVFALPFAIFSLVMAGERWPRPALLGWVVLAMVAARSAAMGVNRLADRRFDAANERTAGRHLVTGALSVRYVLLFTLVCIGLFVLAAANINELALWLSPVVLVVLLGYSFLKRFTSWAHLGVGLALGLAPLGAWVAGRGELSEPWWPLILGAGVTFWVAGFDVIYACQDVEADRRLGLHSIPARFGVPLALRIAALFHVLCLCLFATAGLFLQTFGFYMVSLYVAALLLGRAHLLARRQGIGPANAALMPLNGVVALLLGGAGIADVLLFVA